jgi:D-glycero-D-manno-heptose 1,7-bisphosphate phosphatase
MRRAVFLDRDGVVNRVVMRDGRPASPRSTSELVLEPEARRAAAALRDAGFLLFVVTNQPDLARGKLEPATHAAMMEQVRQALQPDELVACPHDDRDDCPCRKPRPGMLTALAARWDVALEDSYMVGDGWRDMAAGRAAGCRTILLRTDYNGEVAADEVVTSLEGVVDLIVGRRDGVASR